MSDDVEAKPVTEIEKLRAEVAEKKAAMNGFLSRIQELDGENRRLIDHRRKQDERIEGLEKRYRNQKNETSYLQMRERTAHLYCQVVSQALSELFHELLDEGELANLPKAGALMKRIERLVFPDTTLDFLTFSTQLRTWSDTNEEFKKKLEDMGLAPFEAITTDLSEEL